MSDQNQEAQQPSELQQFQQALRQDLGQFAQGVSQRLNAIEQRVTQPKQAPPPLPASPSDLERVNATLRERVIADPLGYTREVIGTAAQEAENRARQIIENERRMQQLSQAYQGFWNGFAQYNQDVAMFGAQVEANLRAGGIDAQRMIEEGRTEELSRYADLAANQVREAVKQRAAWEAQLAQQQQMGARQMQGPPGANFAPQQRLADPNNGMPRDPRAELAEAVNELDAARQKKMWNQIDSQEYRDSSRNREDRVRQDRYVANGRR